MTINLTELFEVQRKLDAEIEKKHPTVPGEDRLAKRILALQVELGECANEWRGFKFWSNRQEPNLVYQTTCDPASATHHYCDECKGVVSNENTNKHYEICEGDLYPMKSKNPLLEEYVDCLHFVLSIGNGLNFDIQMLEQMISPKKMKNLADQFLWTNRGLTNLYEAHRDMTPTSRPHYYLLLFDAIMGLGEMLGFTWEQVTDAYISKNKTNWERQANGY